MFKDAETQPYRNFKNFLDTIIKMPEDLKNRLANEFERRRLEDKPIFGSKKEEENTSIFGSKKDEEEDKSIFADMFSKKDEEKKEDKSIFTDMFSKKEEEEKDKSIFADMFSKKDAEEKKEEEEKTDAEEKTDDEEKTDAEEKKYDDKSFFDRIFSKEESDELIKKFSEPNAAPLKKCQIRPW